MLVALGEPTPKRQKVVIVIDGGIETLAFEECVTVRNFVAMHTSHSASFRAVQARTTGFGPGLTRTGALALVQSCRGHCADQSS